MFIDTHCHLNMIVKGEFNTPLSEENFLMIDQVLQNAHKRGVEKIITIGSSGLVDTNDAIKISQRFKNVFAAIGFHPCECVGDWKKEFLEIKKLVQESEKNKIVGIGETGLDFYHKPFDMQKQIDAFKAHIELALQVNLPLVFHVRNANEEFLTVVEEYKKEIKGVLHCFSHPKDFADTILSWGLFVGIDAPITYPKNVEFREIVKQISLEKILLETDAPFLPPQQFRGKQNLPEYIPLFAQTVADIKQISLDEVEKVTTQNAQARFGI
jgi:TatD DNase family protein